METQFPGYYRKTPDQIRAIWRECEFSFDANVLLNLYRYSTPTADRFVSVLERLSARIWLPWQAASEFHQNRLSVIEKQTRTYEEACKTADLLRKQLENEREHPFVESSLLGRITDNISELVNSLNASKAERRRLLVTDPRLGEISRLFAGRVGAKPGIEIREKWLAEAKTRCEKKIPPGYRDAEKQGDRRYGDTLLWLELIEHTKNSGKPLVFVTDDAKNDWWNEVSGITIGPQPQLVEEFRAATNQDFLLYRPERFTTHAATHLEEPLDVRVIEEMRTKSEERVSRRRRRRAKYKNEEAQSLASLCDHLWMHRYEARELLSAVRELTPQQWAALESPLVLPPKVRFAAERAVRRCRCLVELADLLRQFPSPGYHAAMEELSVGEDAERIALLVDFRQMPQETFEYLKSCRTQNNKPDDVSSLDGMSLL